MKSIEEIIAIFAAIPTADGDRWTVETLAPDRLHLSRGEDGEFAVFLEGPQASFGDIPPWPGLSHSESVLAIPTGRSFSALRLISQDPVHGNRVIGHIAYELARRLLIAPTVENGELLASVAWILPLLGDRDTMLSPERQSGLVGECVLLLRLLGIAARLGLSSRRALERWKGAGTSKRDFAASGAAIEVKTTGHTTRIHHFGSIEQLDPQSPGEEVYLFSLGIRFDASSPKKLPDFLADVEGWLVAPDGTRDEEAVTQFRAQLQDYGYDRRYEAVYRSQAGIRPPHLPPTLYSEKSLARVRLTSFKGNRLPTMVLSVGYDLEVLGSGLPAEETDSILEKFLTAPPLGRGGAGP